MVLCVNRCGGSAPPGLLAAARARVAAPGAPRVAPAFARVSWPRKLDTVRRVLLSQTPFHDPANQPLPDFADRWFTRYARGEDVTHWYTSA